MPRRKGSEEIDLISFVWLLLIVIFFSAIAVHGYEKQCAVWDQQEASHRKVVAANG